MKTLFCTFNPTRDTDDEEYGLNPENQPADYYSRTTNLDRVTRRKVAEPGKMYAYLYTGSRGVAPGDYAVVHNGNHFAVTKIERVKPGIDDKVIKHVLSVVTQEDFQQYLAANRSIKDHRAVFDQLDFMLEEQAKLQKYLDLGKSNPEAAALLSKLNVWHGPTIEAQSATPSYDVPKQD